MIIYFSGTGNSKHIAKLLANSLNDEIVDISTFTRKGEVATFVSATPYVLVVPAYASYIPLFVEKFIIDSTFTGNENFYVVMTCGSVISSGGVSMKIKPVLQDKGLVYKGIKQIRMPENFITMFAAPSKETAEKIVAKAESKLPAVIEIISSGKNFSRASFPSFFTFIENPIFYKYFVNDVSYYVTDECISCGKCEKVCPLSNVQMIDGKPVWKGNCTQCMACISSCPKNAIEYGNKTKKKRRYRLD
ncbi:MAG: EFR1 family ferrodoxin [Clostridia bacterium]|nr:EFR1 family ferrodoxin [Clostridia bacterium]